MKDSKTRLDDIIEVFRANLLNVGKASLQVHR